MSTRLPILFRSAICLMMAIAVNLCLPADARAQLNADNKAEFDALMQKQAEKFPEVPVLKPGQSAADATFSAVLNRDPVEFAGGRYDSVRFRVPDEAEDFDMVWAFAIEAASMHWFILPVEGEMQGFRNWFDGDQVYAELPLAEDENTVLQTLSHESIEAGKEYILWWNFPHGKEVKVRGVIGFYSPFPEDKPRKPDDIDEALGLTPAPAKDQIERLGSRGGEILLDETFFRPSYAEGRIEHYFFTLRHTTQAAGGFVIAMQTSVPPCRTVPPLPAIREKYGDPDLVVDQEDLKKADQSLFTDNADEVVWWYDRFGFVFKKSDPDKKVHTVLSQAYDFSEIGPLRKGLSFADLPMRRMRQFTRDGEVIAWLAGWGTADAALVSGDLPAGNYLRHYDDGAVAQRLNYKGDGAWDVEILYHDGEIYRRVSLKDHAYDGISTDYFEDGIKKAEVPYQAGVVNGTVRYFDEKGELAEEIEVKDGERVDK